MFLITCWLLNNNIGLILNDNRYWTTVMVTCRVNLSLSITMSHIVPNPLDYTQHKNELTTQRGVMFFDQARPAGAVAVKAFLWRAFGSSRFRAVSRTCTQQGFYTILITSGMGLTEQRASDPLVNDALAGSKYAFEQKYNMCRIIKKYEYPMVLNFVIHRHNIDQIEQIIELCLELNADTVELAICQFYGWAFLNRQYLLPTQTQLIRAERITNAYREKLRQQKRPCKLIFVVPDYYEERPKACMNSWGKIFLTIAPDGMALPCHAARQLPMTFPNVRQQSLAKIWYESKAFNQYRGDAWMPEGCRTCPDKDRDFGGCRCQAYMLTGNASNADPVCAKSPYHHLIEQARAETEQAVSLTRNLTDTQLKAIRDSQGMVGVNFDVAFLRPDGQRNADTTINIILDHLEYMMRYLGEEHVGFGSDFDGALISNELKDIMGVSKLISAMRQRSYSDQLIEQICFKNWLKDTPELMLIESRRSSENCVAIAKEIN
ncbi:hypothetical protein FQR65_LT19463 [Abscondita terminalis]|nr:hypothetical protein FQR65_LT19463 [Abscondita terminalis]